MSSRGVYLVNCTRNFSLGYNSLMTGLASTMADEGTCHEGSPHGPGKPSTGFR